MGDGAFVEQAGVVATAVTEADVEAETQQREEDCARGAAIAEAAAHVRIAGAVEADGSTPRANVNGDYARTGEVVNGRAVYVKVGDAVRGLWYDTGGAWRCGTMKNVGKATGYASVMTAAASPEQAAGAVWRVFMGAGKWVEQAGVVATAVTEADVEAEKRVKLRLRVQHMEQLIHTAF